MQLTVIVATLEGCEPAALTDAGFVNDMLEEAIAAGGLSLLHRYVHQFQPQGLTASAVLSESHVALHTWPEHGLLFVDIATCAAPSATRAAFERIRELSGGRATQLREWTLEVATAGAGASVGEALQLALPQ